MKSISSTVRRGVMLSLAALFLSSQPSSSIQPTQAGSGMKRHSNESYGQLPLSFEANAGQFDARVKFASRGNGYNLMLAHTEAAFALRNGETSLDLRMKFAGANPTAEIEGVDPLPGKSNYLAGDDRSKWRTGVENYARVRYREIYPGVDLIFYGNQRQLEYDFVVAPGADPGGIKLQFDGAKKLALDANGDLILRGNGSELRQRKPRCLQDDGSQKHEARCGYRLAGKNQVRFDAGAYDAAKPLIIDPVIAYSTFLGGSGLERAKGIAVDLAGNAYVAGFTASSDFPTKPGAFRTTKSSTADIFVTKLNAAGTAMVYSTYLGGHQEFCCVGLSTDGGLAIDAAVDAGGNVYVTGNTTIRDFPTTPGALQPAHGSNCAPGNSTGFRCHDAFVTKLNVNGDALVYSTFLGGTDFDAGTGIAVDAAGNAYVSGRTLSPNFPVTPGAFQTGSAAAGSAFVVKLNPAGSALVYSTLLGSGSLIAYAIAVDATGNAYVTGHGFGVPTTPGAFQALPPANINAFVTKLNPAGSALVYSTYLGGSDIDLAFDLAVDAAGNAYVTGYTFSRNFPVTPGAFQTVHGGGDQDAFVTKLNPAGSALVYSTYLGGNRPDLGYGIAVDAAGRAAVTGQSFSLNFPITADALRSSIQGVFVTRLDAAGRGLDYSTFIGGNSGTGYGVAVDARGDLYVTGEVFNNNNSDVFITKLSGFSAPAQTIVANVSAASYAPAIARGSIVAAFGPGLANITREAGVMPLPTALGGVTVKVSDLLGVERLAPLFFVSPNQINYLMPPETVEVLANVTVERGGVVIATQIIPITAVAPGLFAANANGQGIASAVALRLTAFGMLTYEPVARFDPQQNRNVAVPIDLGPESDQVFLVLFGTGIRNRSALSAVSARVGGTAAEVLYAGSQQMFAGLDQVNLRLPRTLMGRGEVDGVVMVDGKTANTVKVSLK